MKNEAILNEGAQEIDTSGYEVSDLDNVEISWENDQLDVDAVFTRGFDNPFSPRAFDDLEIECSAENPNLLHGE